MQMYLVNACDKIIHGKLYFMSQQICFSSQKNDKNVGLHIRCFLPGYNQITNFLRMNSLILGNLNEILDM